MKSLPSVTLCCVDTKHPELGFSALLNAAENFDFGEILFFTNENFVIPESHRLQNLRVIRSEQISGIGDYSRFMIKRLGDFISTLHCLSVQWDGFIIHPECWNDEFLNYDYIGAPWRKKEGYVVGNGGFSLRSKKLLDALASDEILPQHPEDDCICDTYKTRLEKQWGIRFAPVSVAERFSFEFTPYQRQFGFHGMSNFPLVLSRERLLQFIEQMPRSLFVNGYFIEFCQRIAANADKALRDTLSARLESSVESSSGNGLSPDQAGVLIESLLHLRLFPAAIGLLLNRKYRAKWKFKYLKIALGRYSGRV